MDRFYALLFGLLGTFVFCILLAGCRGDGDYGDFDDDYGGGGGDGRGASASEACNHSCDCPQGDDLPNCYDICMEGMEVMADPEACAACVADASCDDYWTGHACDGDCVPE